MDARQEIQIAKAVIADQQITLRVQQEQLSAAYFLSPDNLVIHGQCGEEGFSFGKDPKDTRRACPCFRE